jgi:CRP/FNR family transcriptional regulator, cyclic AMP receptor protein
MSRPAQATFLDLLTDADRSELEARAGRRRFKRGATLLNEGAPGSEVMLLTSGRVKVSITTAGRDVVLGFMGPGDLLGELAVISERPRSGTTEALEPVEALAVSAADFRALLGRPSFADAMLRSLVQRFGDSDRGRIEFAAMQSLGRVAARLVELAERHGEPEGDAIAITLPITQEDLAAWIAASREAVAKALASLRDLGAIRTERRRMIVLDLELLKRQAV